MPKKLSSSENAIDERTQHGDRQEPPIPFQSGFVMRRFAELAGDEVIVIEVSARKIESF